MKPIIKHTAAPKKPGEAPVTEVLHRKAFHVTCADGVVLRGQIVLPKGVPRAILQFNAGTAAKTRFYEPFLDFLAGHGYGYAIYDYRGFGESRPATLEGCPFRYSDFGRYDIPAVKSYLRASFPDLPLLMVAHSAGGQQLPLVGDLSGVRGMLCYGVSTGYGPGLASYYRPQAAAMWHVIGPALRLRYGYPALSKLGIMEDLPTPLFREWKRWCTSPDFFFDERFYGMDVPRVDWSRLDFPIKHVHATTDEISLVRNVTTFWRHWDTPRPVEQQVLRPEEFGGKPIRHFDYFRRRFRETLWAEAVVWLDGVVA